MKKIYKLKDWYSVDAAARRLSETLGEEISTTDVLQLAIEGHLPLSWYVRGRPARMVAPVSRIYKKEDGVIFSSPDETGGYAYSHTLTLYPQSHQIVRLEGAFKLEIEMMGWVRDWVLSLITKTGGEFVCMDGFLVCDDDENLWQLLERFPDKLGNNKEDYFPSGELPEPSELGFQKAALEAFEMQLDQQSSPPVKLKPLLTKERETVLKLIIGMAVDGYRYNPKAARSSVAEEITDKLVELGLPLDSDTVRKWLREAGDILPPSSNPETDAIKTKSFKH